MHLVFLGTASCFPTPARGVSCIAVQWESGDIWIFDCGEGSQIQIQKSRLRPGKVTKIFITHLHGDHLFGLPGFLCTLGNGGAVDDKKIDVYGPYGLRKFVKMCLDVSQSPLPFACTFHEMIPNDDQFLNEDQCSRLHKDLKEDLRDLTCLDTTLPFNEDLGCWKLFSSETVSVSAGPIKHRIPSFGYLIQEQDSPGSLNVEKLTSMGLKPGPMYADLKQGRSITMDDGRVVTPQDVLGQTKKGRKVVILGDTCDSSGISTLSADCDLLVHEATMEESLRDKALEYGHSTPSMAAEFAESVGAKRLCLTHVSPRYKPISLEKDERDRTSLSAKLLLDEARKYLGSVGSKCEAEIAEDFYEVKL